MHALAYLGVWFGEDKWFHKYLKSGAAGLCHEERCSKLADAARYYGVTRTLPKLNSEKFRLETALRILDGMADVQSPDVSARVEELNKALSIIYWQGKKNNDGKPRVCISAASKFLWMRFRSPIIIFDSQALASLCEYDPMLREVKDGDSYAKYAEVWRNYYDLHAKTLISDACGSLPSYEGHLRGAESSLLELTCKPWFMERVFDQWLWTSDTPNSIKESGLRFMRGR